MRDEHDEKKRDDETKAAPESARATVRVRAVHVEVASGRDAGKIGRVDAPTFVIGTAESADLRLSDPTVSREHLRLRLTPEGLRLHDDGSKNGTWIGGVRITDGLVTTAADILVATTRILLRPEAAVDLAISAEPQLGDAIGVSPAMRHLFGVLERAAATDVTVLLEGESGVGKDVLARAIHARSARAARPYVAVDCGAIAPGLVESELFGHERGAFTGAASAHVGVFEQADGGTLFLDEIGELPVELQPKLLRALEQREIRPLGARTVRTVDVRVLAATNRRLADRVKEGTFRTDLYYRLAVARAVVPPLRDRPEDIVPIARALFRAATRDPSAELPPDFSGMLTAYGWPGNVRELRNVVERYALLGARDAGTLFDAAASPSTTEGALAHLPYHEARRQVLDAFERGYLPAVLARADGVVARAAELAGVARPSFYRLLERIGANPGK